MPNLLLGSLLQDIHSLAELKCTLRTLELVRQRRARRNWITLAELLADPVLLSALADEPQGAAEAIRIGALQAAERGTLLASRAKGGDPSNTLLLINDEAGRRTISQFGEKAPRLETSELPDGQPNPAPQPTIFSLYEENIGAVTPLLVEELKEAEEVYPASWIHAAFQEAVSRNRRSWKYIARILERWASEGKDDGEPGRHPQTTDPKEYLRDYIRRRGPIRS